MSTLLRSVLVLAAIIGSVSTVSAASRPIYNPYTYSSPSDFNPATYFDDVQRKLG